VTSEDRDPFNPYAAPSARLANVEEPVLVLDPASRWARLGASLLDDLIGAGPILLLAWGVTLAMGYGFSLTEAVENEPSELVNICIFVLTGNAVYLGLHGYLLVRKGQTLGKLICGIRIVRQDGTPADLWDSFVKRHFPLVVIQQIPFLGKLAVIVDPLFIFRENRLCLHDEVAGTMVVRTRPRPQPVPHRHDAAVDVAPRRGETTLCPFCATRVGSGERTCPDCKRDIFLVDTTSANRELSLGELLRKAYRLDTLGFSSESLDVLLLATRREPDCRDAWVCIRDMATAPEPLRAEARAHVERIQRQINEGARA
jgi:uncharacterized RDD family membrane protein YckC